MTQNLITHIQQKKQSLKNELEALDYTNNIDNLTIPNYEEKRRLAIVSKIQVLNELVISFGVQKPKK